MASVISLPAGLARQRMENARLTTREIDKHCALDDPGATLLQQATSQLGLHARNYPRILNVPRTVADTASAGGVRATPVAEAIQYRRFDRS